MHIISWSSHFSVTRTLQCIACHCLVVFYAKSAIELVEIPQNQPSISWSRAEITRSILVQNTLSTKYRWTCQTSFEELLTKHGYPLSATIFIEEPSILKVRLVYRHKIIYLLIFVDFYIKYYLKFNYNVFIVSTW